MRWGVKPLYAFWREISAKLLESQKEILKNWQGGVGACLWRSSEGDNFPNHKVAHSKVVCLSGEKVWSKAQNNDVESIRASVIYEKGSDSYRKPIGDPCELAKFHNPNISKQMWQSTMAFVFRLENVTLCHQLINRGSDLKQGHSVFMSQNGCFLVRGGVKREGSDVWRDWRRELTFNMMWSIPAVNSSCSNPCDFTKLGHRNFL